MSTRGRRRAGEGRETYIPEWVGGRPAGRRPAKARPRPATNRPARRAGTVRAARRAPRTPGIKERRALFGLTLGLLLYGLVMAYSASTAKAYFTYGSSYYVIERQAFFAVLGVIAMLVLSRVDYVWWQRAALPLSVIALVALAAVLIPGVGSEINGARRWIIVRGFSFSPSELAKLAAITLVAGLVVRKPWELTSGKGFARLVGIGIGPAAALIMLEPDLGTTIILTFAVIAVLIAGGAQIRHLAALAGAGVLAVAAMIAVEPYRVARITAFIDPWQDPQGSGFQTTQSLISIASGRIFGVGLGNSIQKFGFLPEQTTDMITGIIGEELGLIGLLVLIGLYVALTWTILRIALNCREMYGKLLAVGIGSAVAGQAAINIGAALGLLPLTGVPLPLVSCGGTSLVVVLAGIGIIANIATNRRSYIVASPERSSSPRRGGGDRRSPDPGARRR